MQWKHVVIWRSVADRLPITFPTKSPATPLAPAPYVSTFRLLLADAGAYDQRAQIPTQYVQHKGLPARRGEPQGSCTVCPHPHVLGAGYAGQVRFEIQVPEGSGQSTPRLSTPCNRLLALGSILVSKAELPVHEAFLDTPPWKPMATAHGILLMKAKWKLGSIPKTTGHLSSPYMNPREATFHNQSFKNKKIESAPAAPQLAGRRGVRATASAGTRDTPGRSRIPERSAWRAGTPGSSPGRPIAGPGSSGAQRPAACRTHGTSG